MSSLTKLDCFSNGVQRSQREIYSIVQMRHILQDVRQESSSSSLTESFVLKLKRSQEYFQQCQEHILPQRTLQYLSL